MVVDSGREESTIIAEVGVLSEEEDVDDEVVELRVVHPVPYSSTSSHLDYVRDQFQWDLGRDAGRKDIYSPWRIRQKKKVP